MRQGLHPCTPSPPAPAGAAPRGAIPPAGRKSPPSCRDLATLFSRRPYAPPWGGAAPQGAGEGRGGLPGLSPARRGGVCSAAPCDRRERGAVPAKREHGLLLTPLLTPRTSTNPPGPGGGGGVSGRSANPLERAATLLLILEGYLQPTLVPSAPEKS